MYKTFLFFVLATILMVNANAQLQVEFVAGVNYLDFHDDTPSLNHRQGWTAGMNIRLGDGLFVKPGIHFHSFTTRPMGMLHPTDICKETQVQFFKVPMDLGVRLTPEDQFFEMHIHAGIVTNVLIQVNQKNLDFDEGRIYGSNFGANAGVVVDLSIFTIGLQYEYGLTKLSRMHEGKNNMLMFNVGILL